MRNVILLFAAAALLRGAAENPAVREWMELKGKRERLPSFHQEFEVTGTSTSSHGVQSSKRRVVVDASGQRWRTAFISGSGKRTQVFDGEQTFAMEEGGDEYIRTKHRDKDEVPLPSPYDLDHADWAKATEMERRLCGTSQADSQCVLLKVPVKPWKLPGSPDKVTRITEGVTAVLIETATGLIIATRTVQRVETTQLSYRSEISYDIKRMKYGAPADAALFQLPLADMREVRELPAWNAAKIRKQLAGMPAPELEVTDIGGKPLTLAAFKGKTVLLDFWTTWCPPCRRDAPALDKLYSKYGGRDLMIVSISVSEERAIVEKYLSEHPHDFPVILTTENEMPRPYQISAFPTYIVIDREGAVMAAAEGDQGFGELRKLLKKAGVEAE